jgi:hypothetical protein
MGKKGKKRKQQTEPPPDDPDEIEGFVEDETLYLRDATGVVYSTERDDRGALVAIGKWDPSTSAIVRTLSVEPTDSPASPGVAAAPPSTPHPPPAPLAFAAAEDDHCETAPEAYAHIADLLMLVALSIGKTAETLRIYDPYYCNGAVVRHLGALGFASVYNTNEDFYAVLAEGRLPAFDVIVTNPPYVAGRANPHTRTHPPTLGLTHRRARTHACAGTRRTTRSGCSSSSRGAARRG